MRHLMVDLETLDTRPSSVVISVGACVFDREGIHKKGYWVLDIDDQLRRGRTVSASTISWWMRQSDPARAVLTKLDSQPWTIQNFATQYKGFFEGEKLAVWGNGSDFDTAIMIDFWQRHQLEKIPGWSYSNNMCFRTYNKLFNCKVGMERKGTHHNALDDAIFQAECVINAVKNGAPLP